MAKILIIDDDARTLRACCDLLTDAGHDVIVAECGRSGLRAFDAYKPDVVLTDILMPGQDGFETIMAIRRRDPHVGVIAMSAGWSGIPTDGRPDLDLLRMAGQLGACCQLRKPLVVEDVMTTVAGCMEGRVAREHFPGQASQARATSANRAADDVAAVRTSKAR